MLLKERDNAQLGLILKYGAKIRGILPMQKLDALQKLTWRNTPCWI
jgi:hypothetical protein